MIVGIGIDITEIGRVRSAVKKNPRFLDKVLTNEELAQTSKMNEKRKMEYAAGRFSAKESYSKALGSGLGSKVQFSDLAIVDNENGKPEFLRHPFDGKAHISISHTKDLVVTEVILERES